jgi:aspartyl-tRNA(Asn)/glutamyl-tRNA(Gln) amidotransferase subunit C
MDKETAIKAARLARLELTAEQQERYGRELAAIVDWFAKLSEVDTEGTEPMTGVVNRPLTLRKDKATGGFIGDALMRHAPKARYGYYSVTKVME